MVERPTLPILAEIIGDLEIVDGQCILPAERCLHWGDVLKKSYWGFEHREVYLQLGGFALKLAERKAPAALQFIALATLPDAAKEAHKARGQNGFARASATRARAAKLIDAGTRRDAVTLAGPTVKATSFIPRGFARA